METLKHECGVAMVRLRKPLSYYKEKYGTFTYALDRLYLLMEKQHNRGQEAAGVGVVKLNAPAGHEYVFRERALGTGAIDSIFQSIGSAVSSDVNSLPVGEVERYEPFIGEINMGHLRYSTTGRSGMQFTHPFLRRNNWRSRALMLCGNFNMTNVDQIFDTIVSTGQHPRIYSDTVLLLEQIGHELDKENDRQYKLLAPSADNEMELTHRIEAAVDIPSVLRKSAPQWDGGFAICGATGAGWSFVLRDSHGIRPAFYYADDEVIVVASERPVIQTVFNVLLEDVKELEPGKALIIDPQANWHVEQILEPLDNRRCSFERIYFSRGSDADIYRERKRLGANIVPALLHMVNNDFENTVYSFIPNTAEVAFIGMVEELNRKLDSGRKERIMRLSHEGALTDAVLTDILDQKVRVEKIAIKDIKLRTFIAEGSSRNDLATHVYDVTYGCINTDKDTLVVIDDSIVRGTTLKQSILRILDRLRPSRIIVVSSSPQVRYPDYYGIDMPRLEELAAFRAVVHLLVSTGRSEIIEQAYRDATAVPAPERNVVKDLYAPFTDAEISRAMAEMLTPAGLHAKVDLLFQSLEGLHDAVPGCPGDWYFSGDYPTPGGTSLVNAAFCRFYREVFKK